MVSEAVHCFSITLVFRMLPMSRDLFGLRYLPQRSTAQQKALTINILRRKGALVLTY